MKPRTMALGMAISMGLFATGVLAQHEQHHSAPPSVAGDNEKSMMPGNMPQMMTSQQEISTLASRLAESFAVIEKENNPALLQSKMAEHGALLKELQVKLQGQSEMITKMRGQMMMMGHMKSGSVN